MARDLGAVIGDEVDELEDEDIELEEDELEEDDEDPPSDEEEEAERIAALRKARKTGKQSKDEDEIEIVEIRDGDRKWDKDPASEIEDPTDKTFKGKFQKRINKLTATASELARERDKAARDREEVVAYARAQAARIAQLEAANLNSTAGSIEAQIASLDHEAALADSDYRLAASLADVDKMAIAQNKLVTARTKSAQLKTQVELLSGEKEAAKAKETQAVAEAEEANRLFKQRQQAPQVPQSRAEWFASNPWFDRTKQEDPKSAYALYQDKVIRGKGIQGDSALYYKELDKAMRAKFPKFFGMQRSTTVPARRENRSEVQRPNIIKGNKVFLTKQQKATALSLGLSTPKQLKAYAIEISKVQD